MSRLIVLSALLIGSGWLMGCGAEGETRAPTPADEAEQALALQAKWRKKMNASLRDMEREQERHGVGREKAERERDAAIGAQEQAVRNRDAAMAAGKALSYENTRLRIPYLERVVELLRLSEDDSRPEAEETRYREKLAKALDDLAKARQTRDEFLREHPKLRATPPNQPAGAGK